LPAIPVPITATRIATPKSVHVQDTVGWWRGFSAGRWRAFDPRLTGK
jgi:hypothetical protein